MYWCTVKNPTTAEVVKVTLEYVGAIVGFGVGRVGNAVGGAVGGAKRQEPSSEQPIEPATLDVHSPSLMHPLQ